MQLQAELKQQRELQDQREAMLTMEIGRVREQAGAREREVAEQMKNREHMFAEQMKLKEQEVVAMSDPREYVSKKKEVFEKYLAILRETPIEARLPEEFRDLKNIGFIGPTSSGKSTLLNTLARSKVAKTGVGQTTLDIAPVLRVHDYQLWDFPGSNDEIEYLDYKFLAFLTCFTKIYVLFDSDVRACLNILRLLDSLKIPMALLRTKCDIYDPSEFEELQEQKKKTREFLTENHLPGIEVYNVSTRNVIQGGELFDWQNFLVDLLDGKSLAGEVSRL